MRLLRLTVTNHSLITLYPCRRNSLCGSVFTSCTSRQSGSHPPDRHSNQSYSSRSSHYWVNNCFETYAYYEVL